MDFSVEIDRSRTVDDIGVFFQESEYLLYCQTELFEFFFDLPIPKKSSCQIFLSGVLHERKKETCQNDHHVEIL